MEKQGGMWKIILRRMDGSVNFYIKWAQYKAGLGYVDGKLGSTNNYNLSFLIYL